MTMTGTEQALRYVAIGDSLSEGVGDEPWPDGSLRGWTDRLAVLLADHHAPGRAVTYANLAVRGLTASRVRDTQVEVAAAMHPDVVTLTAGMNDLLRPKVDFDALRRTLVDIVTPFTSVGARLVIVPIPDVRSVSPAGQAGVPAAAAAASICAKRSPMRMARACVALSGRTMTMKSVIRPSSPRTRKSQPVSRRPSTLASNT